MRVRWALAGAAVAILIAAGALYSQTRRWQQYEWEMQNPAYDPPDAWVEAEFAFARLRFRSFRDRYGRGHLRWGTDANKSDRQFIMGLRRLTRINARSVEQIVDIDSDEIFDWPFLYGVGIGDWTLSPEHIDRLRKYFERGGFFVVDDFHGEREWATFMEGVRQVIPDGTLVELPDDAEIFHTVYDLSERLRVPGRNIIRGQPYERGGYGEYWRAMVGPDGRIQIGMFYNQDLGDAWEWADDPLYPERYASSAYRLGVNYVVYAMTR